MNETVTGQPLAGLRAPSGEITTGDRPIRTLRQRNARIARAFELSGKRVLDLGCAEGLHSLYMSESADEVVGIDHRMSVIARAEANRKLLGKSNVTFKCGDVRDEKIFDDSRKFDLVIAWGFLHRVTDIFSFLQNVSGITKAVSLEWRTPLFPLMGRLSVAYHSPFGEALDPMNLHSHSSGSDGRTNSIADSEKIEGQTGFWEPTPGAIKVIFRRLGFRHSRCLGYGEQLSSQTRSIAYGWASQVRRALSGQLVQQLPFGRVHMFFEKDKGSIEIRNPHGNGISIPEWDDAARRSFK